MFKQIIITTILILICLCSASSEIVYKTRFANHSVCIDDSIYGFDGVYYNPEFDTGVINGALVINAINSSYVKIDNPQNLSFTDGTIDLPFSVCFWVKIDDPSLPSPILSKGSPTDKIEYTITTIGTNPHGSITLNDAYTGYQISCQSEECLCEYNLTNGWLHVIITYDGSSHQDGLNMYFNGYIIPTTKSGHPGYICMRNQDGNMYLGLDVLLGHTTFGTSSLDEIIIHDIELTDAQVQHIFNSYEFNSYSITLIDEDLISIDKNISVYKNNEYVKTIVYGESINISNVFEYSFVLHEDSFDRFSHIENITDTSINGITYLVYAFVFIGIIALLMFMYRRF